MVIRNACLRKTYTASRRLTIASSLNPVNGGDGAEVLQGVNPAIPTVELISPTSALEGGPADSNLEFASPEVNTDPAFTEDERSAVTKALQASVAKVLPGKRVSVSLVRELYSLKYGTAIIDRATGIENARAGICATSITGSRCLVTIHRAPIAQGWDDQTPARQTYTPTPGRLQWGGGNAPQRRRSCREPKRHGVYRAHVVAKALNTTTTCVLE